MLLITSSFIVIDNVKLSHLLESVDIQKTQGTSRRTSLKTTLKGENTVQAMGF
jgi:hypothetical protein